MKRERVVTRWALLMVGDSGPLVAGCEGLEIRRTSTPLLSFDRATLTGTTASGRPYRLVGGSEPNYALSVFHSLWHTGAVVRVVTLDQAAELAKCNQPFDRDPEEKTRLDLIRLRHLSAQVALQMRVHDLDEPQVAARSGLTLDKLRGLLEHNLSRITVEEADEAFVNLVGARTVDDNEPEAGPRP